MIFAEPSRTQNNKLDSAFNLLDEVTDKIVFDMDNLRKEKIFKKINDDFERFEDPDLILTGEAWHRQLHFIEKDVQKINIIEVRARKGFKMKEHSHKGHSEGCFVIHGMIKYDMHDLILGEGNMARIPRGEPHTFEALEDSVCLIIYKPRF